MGNQQKLAEIFTKGIIVNIAPKMRIVIACQVSTQLFCIWYQSIAIFYLYLCAKFHEDWLRTHGVIHSLVKLVDSQSAVPAHLGQSSKVLVSHPSLAVSIWAWWDWKCITRRPYIRYCTQKTFAPVS